MIKTSKKVTGKPPGRSPKVSKSKKVPKPTIPMESDNESEELDRPLSEEAIEESPANSEDEIEQHKDALAKLKSTDPEFYQFLEQNDRKLLQFDVSDSEAESDVEDVHKPSQELEVASDESDFEEQDEDHSPHEGGKVTLKLLKRWEHDIQTDKTNKTITTLIQAFHGALMQVTSQDSQDSDLPYVVEGAAVFNGVIQLCVLHLGPALKRFLNVETRKQPPHKCKKFIKIKNALKDYFTDLSKLLGGVSSANIQTVLLKHLHYMSPFLQSYQNVSKTLLKTLVSIWGRADDGVRVVAFFCILRITTANQAVFLDDILKLMHVTYVKNTKFVSVSNLAALNFMRRSLVEMFSLDPNTSYRHAFLYIRQLAILLRNAITDRKKEHVQTVYNWQFVNSLKLWGSLLGANPDKQLAQLIYPLVQVCLGTIKLCGTAQYYPLRFHIVEILTHLARDSGVFVPVLPQILQVLTSYDFNKKNAKLSMKPLSFVSILRASKSQMAENAFKDALIEAIYASLIDYLVVYANSMAFPDLTLLCQASMRDFLKKCANANYTRKMKQLLEKIRQNADFIEAERSKHTINLANMKQIDGVEAQIANKTPPLKAFHENWSKVNNIKKNKQATRNDQIADYKLPTLNKNLKISKRKNPDGPVELFPSDSEDELTTDGAVQQPRKKKNLKTKRQRTETALPLDEDKDVTDVVTDLDLNEWT